MTENLADPNPVQSNRQLYHGMEGKYMGYGSKPKSLVGLSVLVYIMQVSKRYDMSLDVRSSSHHAPCS